MCPPEDPPVEPEAFLRALLAVSAEDAEEVREVADTKAKPDAKAQRGTDQQ